MLLSYFLWVRRQLPCVVTTGCSHGCSGLKSYCENNSSNSNNNNNNNNNQKQQQQSTGRIIAATKSYPGSENDKTIILRDKYLADPKRGAVEELQVQPVQRGWLGDILQGLSLIHI